MHDDILRRFDGIADTFVFGMTVHEAQKGHAEQVVDQYLALRQQFPRAQVVVINHLTEFQHAAQRLANALAAAAAARTSGGGGGSRSSTIGWSLIDYSRLVVHEFFSYDYTGNSTARHVALAPQALAVDIFASIAMPGYLAEHPQLLQAARRHDTAPLAEAEAEAPFASPAAGGGSPGAAADGER